MIKREPTALPIDVASPQYPRHRRNGVPPWPGVDDCDHEPCEHDTIRALLPLITCGSLECVQCGRIVTIEGLRA